ncbi:MAG: hypothetical protein ACWGNI_00205 [Desulfobacterales bacterium]
MTSLINDLDETIEKYRNKGITFEESVCALEIIKYKTVKEGVERSVDYDYD